MSRHDDETGDDRDWAEHVAMEQLADTLAEAVCLRVEAFLAGYLERLTAHLAAPSEPEADPRRSWLHQASSHMPAPRDQ